MLETHKQRLSGIKEDQRQLLVLDINGLLCRKVKKYSEEHIQVDLQLQSYGVKLRPGYRKFLTRCYTKYDVAFFTSTTQRNAEIILKKLLTKKQFKQVKFVWYRDRTYLDPDWYAFGESACHQKHSYEISAHPSWEFENFQEEQIQKHSTIKHLSAIWRNPIINAERKYSEKNTLICDDSYMKLRLNPRSNCLPILPYVKDEEEQTLNDVWKEIVKQFAELQVL